MVDQVADLLGLLKPTRSGVGDGPAGLLSGLQVAVREEMNERWDNVGINNSLDLGGVASGDVRDGPAGLFPDPILSRAQEGQESWESTAIDDDLSLDVVTGNDIADRSQGWGLDGGGCMHKQLNKAARDAGFDDGLDLVVRSIGEVGDSPAGIDQDLIVERVDKLRQDRQSGQDLLDMLAAVSVKPGQVSHGVPVWLRGLSTTEVAQGPGGVAKHAQLAAIAQEGQERLESTTCQDIVAA